MLIRVHLWLDLFRRPPDPSATFPHGELELNRLSRTTLDLLSCGLDYLVAPGIGLKSHSDPVRSGLDEGAELPASVRAWSFYPGDPCRHFPRTEVKQFTSAVGIGLPPQIDFRNCCPVSASTTVTSMTLAGRRVATTGSAGGLAPPRVHHR